MCLPQPRWHQWCHFYFEGKWSHFFIFSVFFLHCCLVVSWQVFADKLTSSQGGLWWSTILWIDLTQWQPETASKHFPAGLAIQIFSEQSEFALGLSTGLWAFASPNQIMVSWNKYFQLISNITPLWLTVYLILQILNTFILLRLKYFQGIHLKWHQVHFCALRLLGI